MEEVGFFAGVKLCQEAAVCKSIAHLPHAECLSQKELWCGAALASHKQGLLESAVPLFAQLQL